MKFTSAILVTSFLALATTSARADEEIKTSVLKYELAKKYQAQEELTVERARTCASTWLFFRSLALITDELATYNADFAFTSTDWLTGHWVTTMESQETLNGETETRTARIESAEKVKSWDFDTKMAWAGICFVKEGDRAGYDPSITKAFGQPGDYDEFGNPIK